MEKNLEKFNNKNVVKTLFFLSYPSLISMVSTAFAQIINVAFVGMLNDNALLATLSVCFPLFTVVNAAGQMIGISLLSLGGRTLGKDNFDSFKSIASSGIIYGIVVYLLFILFAVFLLNPLLKFMGAYEKILDYSKEYAFYLLIFSIFPVYNMIFNNLLRALGKVNHSMISMLISAILNISLDALFIFALKLKIIGLIISVITSQAGGCIYAFIVLLKNKAFSFKHLELKMTFFEIFKIGLPTFLMQLGASISVWILNQNAANISEEAISGFGIGNKIYNLVFQTILGYTQGYLPFVAYQYGKNAKDKLHTSLRISITSMLFITAIFSIVFFIFSNSIVSLFSQDKKVIIYAQLSLLFHASSLLIVSIIQVLTVYFQGVKKALFAGILSLSRQVVFLLPASIVFSNFLNGYFAVITPQPTADVLTFIVLIIGLFIIKRNNRLKNNQNTV